MSDDYQYKAFISYSHSDEKSARWLHRSLESYKPPKHLVGTRTEMGEVPAKMAPVFRDREELASSTDLGADLTAALEGSACQIVICSMASAKSHWVNKEILEFKRLGRSRRVFSLIVDGEPYASDSAGTAQYECFPPALRFKTGDDGELTDEQAEPIAADIRPGKDGKNHAKVKLLAGILGVGFDDLRQRELQRRNRRLAVICGAAVLGMVVAIGLATTAVIARNEAQVQSLRAQETADFIIDLFKVSDPGEARGRTITVREILIKGADRIEVELSGQPVVQTDMMNTIGQVFTGLGLYEDALGMLEPSLARRREIAGTAAAEMNDSLYSLANVLTLQAEFEKAEQLYLEAIDRLEEDTEEHAEARIDNFAGLAELYFQTGQYEKAEPILRQVLADRQRILGARSPAFAEAMEELGLNMFDRGRYEEAAKLVRDALELRTDILGSEPHPDISANLSNLGLIEQKLGRYDETEKLIKQALAMDRLLYGERHPDIALDLNNLAEVYLDKDELEKAESLYLEALVMQSELLGENHPEVARVWNNLAFVHYNAGDLLAAQDSMQRSITILQHTHGEEHPDIARSLSTLGRWLAEAGESAAAERILRKALAQQQKLLQSDHDHTALTRMALADLLNRDGRVDEALASATEAEQSLQRTLGEDHWFTAMAHSVHGSVLGALGKRVQAEKMLLGSYQRLEADDSAVPAAVEQALLRLINFYEAGENSVKAGEYLAIYQRDYGE